jgi:hypothetical protein
MNEPTWLDYLNAFSSAIGNIATPIVVALLTYFIWKWQTRAQRRQELEDKLRDDRISIYNDLLAPFVIHFMPEGAWRSDPKNKNKNKSEVFARMLLSLEYRQTGFRLSLIGSDAVIRSYNDLMQYFYQRPPQPAPHLSDVKAMVSLLGTLLLEIRRSMGNEATKLDNWSMLEWFITDARQVRAELQERASERDPPARIA